MKRRAGLYEYLTIKQFSNQLEKGGRGDMCKTDQQCSAEFTSSWKCCSIQLQHSVSFSGRV